MSALDPLHAACYWRAESLEVGEPPAFADLLRLMLVARCFPNSYPGLKPSSPWSTLDIRRPLLEDRRNSQPLAILALTAMTAG